MPLIDRIVPALASEIGDAVAALLGESTTTSPIVNGGEAGWMVHLSVQGAIQGEVVVGLPEDDGRRISALAAGLEGDPGDGIVLETLRKICNEAAASISRKDAAAGLTVAVSDVARAGTPTLEAAHAFEFTVRQSPVRFFVHATLADMSEAAARSGDERDVSDADAASAVVGVTTPGTAATTAVSTQNLDVLLDVELPVSVRFGQAELALQTLMRLAPGAVVDLHRTADEPVDVLVSGKVIARGEVVVVDGNYGVRVLEIVSAAERIRSLGA